LKGLLIALVAAAVLLGAAGLDYLAGEQARPVEILVEGRFAGPALLGFRDVAVDFLWLDAFYKIFVEVRDAKTEAEKRLVVARVDLIFSSIFRLDPHYVKLYDLAAWHLAWNLPPILGATSEEARRYIERGEDLLERGVRRNPDLPDVYQALAFYHFQKTGNLPRVVEVLEEVRRRFPPGIPVITKPGQRSIVYCDHLLGTTYFYLRDYEASKAVWESVLALKPDDVIAPQKIAEAEAFAQVAKIESEQGVKAALDALEAIWEANFAAGLDVVRMGVPADVLFYPYLESEIDRVRGQLGMPPVDFVQTVYDRLEQLGIDLNDFVPQVLEPEEGHHHHH